MGGIGKTETVLQFLQNPRIREIYWAFFWIDCTNDTSAQESFRRIGKAIGLEHNSTQDVKHQLATGSRLTLVILDNCDDPTLNYSNEHVPFATHVRVILTGRTQECERYASHDMQHNIDYQYVGGLSTDASTELVLVLSRDHKSRNAGNTAAQLAKVLGYHPLAIHVACLFIRRYTFTISDYISAFETAQIRSDEYSSKIRYTQSQLLDSTIADTQYKSIYYTFDATIAALLKDKNDATMWSINLLYFAACVDRSRISLDIFLRAWSFEETVKQRIEDPLTLGLTDVHVKLCQYFGDRNKGLYFGSAIKGCCSHSGRLHHPKAWSQKRITKMQKASLDFGSTAQLHQTKSVAEEADKRLRYLQQGMARLCEAELATFEERDQMISFHPVVHAWAKSRLDKSFSKCRALAISGSILALAVGDAVDWNPSNSYLRKHLEAYLTNDNWKVHDTTFNGLEGWTTIDMSRAHMALAYQLMHMDCTRVAEELRKLMSTLEASPQQAVDQILCLQAKELLYASLPRDDPNRVEMQKTIVASIAAVVVPDNGSMASMGHHLLVAQHNLADAYLENGRTIEAIQYLEHLEQNYPKTEWDYDCDLLAIKDLLGVAYRMNGEYDRAMKILQGVVQQREEYEEEGDQLWCSSRTCLADVYIDQSDFTSAIQIMEKTLKVMLNTRTEDDHFLLLSRQTMAKAYAGSGDFEKGIETMRDVLKIRESVYGLFHSESIEAAECFEAMRFKHGNYNNRANKSNVPPAGTAPSSEVAPVRSAASLYNESGGNAKRRKLCSTSTSTSTDTHHSV